MAAGIAELKKGITIEGLIRPDFDPASWPRPAAAWWVAGSLAVLPTEPFFHGSLA